jgi:hypothetical protein
MKKIISSVVVIFCFVLFADKLSAQGNLQFNQVVTIIVPANTIVAFTVPAGKVWKIESAGMGGPSSSSLILRDASALPIAYFFGSTSSSGGNAPFPFWLPSSFSGSFQSTGTNPYRDVISIIEFNVIP